MLDIMRRKKRLKAVLWLVIISLGLGMLLLFVPGANIGSAGFDTSAATVDGDPISFKDFMSTYRRVIDSYSSGGKNRTDPETLKALGLGRQALDSLISVRVVSYAAKRLGLDVSPDEVRKAVQNNPNLQDRGAFIGVERYKALLNANNISVTEFEEGLRNMLLAAKVRNVIADSIDVGERELRDEYARSNLEAQVRFVVLKKDDFKKSIKPGEAELRAYFDANKDKYHIKEQRRAQFLVIPLGSVASTINVTDKDVTDEWARLAREETVDASHILFLVKDPAKDAEVRAKAEAVLKRARAGEDFAELAKKYSEDEGSAQQGGNLGPFPRGRLFREFENAAFALKPGEISDLVKTEAGYHIIKVLNHDIPSLEASRPSLVQSIKLNKASEVMGRKSQEARKLAESEKDLQAIANKLNIPTEMHETPFVDKSVDPFAVGLSQPLLDEIFRLKEINQIGKPVDVPVGTAIPKLLETRLPKPPEFTEARAAVEKDYIELKAAELMNAAAARLSKEASASGDLEAAAKKDGFTSKLTESFKRDATPDPEIGGSPQFAAAAFELPVGSVSAPLALEPGSKIAVLQLKTRTPFDEEAYKKQRSELRQRLVSIWQDSYFQEYIRRVTENLEKSGKIRVNSQALEQVAGVRY